jgi:methyltransferase (TIGR00027 family)
VRAGRPSRTAQHNALFRALEQRLPEPLFCDPWARRFLRGRYRWAALLPASLAARAIDRRWPGPRAAVCVRTRYLDEAVLSALAEGLDQIAILGAGLDSRPYRLPGIERVRVFEVDHPSTQAMKRAVVGAAPAHVVYVPADLAREPLDRALQRAGFRPDVRTLFLWEGVTNYLDDASVDATLRFVARSGRSLLFTYIDRAILDGSRRFAGAAESMAHVRRLGEPFTWGLDPDGVRGYLDERGLDLVEDQPLSELAKRYYTGDVPVVSAFYHVVAARCRA